MDIHCLTYHYGFVFCFLYLDDDFLAFFTTWKPSKWQEIAIHTNSAEVFAIWR